MNAPRRRAPGSLEEPVVRFTNVTKAYRLYTERNQDLKRVLLRRKRAAFDTFLALKDVSFDIHRGESFGIIGPNGAGKSTSLKLIAGTLIPDIGTVTTKGTISALLELGAGFHPELTGMENIFLNGALLGISKKTLTERMDAIVEFAGIGEHIESPVKTYSSGMYARLGFSVAINVDPDILLIDEVLAVGDAQFQRRCLEKIDEFRNAGKTVVFVSHGLAQVRALTDRVAWIDHGNLVRVGPSSELLDEYEHVALGTIPGEAHSLRSGSGEARVTVASVDQPSTTLSTGDRIVVRLTVKASTALAGVAVGMWIRRLDGQLLAWSDTRTQVPLDLAQGDTTLEYEVPRLSLLPGSYMVSTVVFDPVTNHVFDDDPKASRLEVGVGPGPDQEGMFTLQGTWRRAGAAQGAPR